MRIAVWHNLPSGGGNRAMYDHVRGLVARGHDIEVWCPPTADRTFLPFNGLVREHIVDLDWPHRLRVSDYLMLTLEVERGLKAMDAHCLQCAAEIERGGFDVLFANSCMFYRATAIGRYTSLPSLLYLQEPYRWLYEASPQLRWLARADRAHGRATVRHARDMLGDARLIRNSRIQARAEVENAAAFGRILVNSYYSRESVLRAYGLNADVCYLGIDTDYFAPRQVARTDGIIGLGSIARIKNIELCIAAMGAIAAPRPPLTWVGNFSDDDYAAELHALAASLDVAFVPMVGVTDSDLLDLLSRSAMMLYAPRLEPFGLAPLEANACELPVIAVAEGGVRETIIHNVNGVLVDHDPAAMAAAIGELRGNPAQARALGEEGRRVTRQKWGFSASTDRIEKKLTDCASSASGEMPQGLEAMTVTVPPYQTR